MFCDLIFIFNHRRLLRSHLALICVDMAMFLISVKDFLERLFKDLFCRVCFSNLIDDSLFYLGEDMLNVIQASVDIKRINFWRNLRRYIWSLLWEKNWQYKLGIEPGFVVKFVKWDIMLRFRWYSRGDWPDSERRLLTGRSKTTNCDTDS